MFGSILVDLKRYHGDKMEKTEKSARLKRLLTQIAPGNSIEAVSRPDAKAIDRDGFESLGPDHVGAAESGLQKLAEDRVQEITPSEMFGLEAIVLPRNRPVAFVRGNSYDNLDGPWVSLNDDVVKRRIASLLPLIGRVEVPSSPILPYAGTGFVVGQGLIATNRHVAQIFAQGLGLTIRYRAGDAAIDFKRQVDALDDRIFNRTYNVKRLQPGVIRTRAKVQSFENTVNAVTHDASTLGGNSGSAVIEVDTGEIVALHFAGEYLKANYAVPMYELARDSRVASRLNFEGTLPPTNDWAPAWRSVEGTDDSASAAAPPQAEEAIVVDPDYGNRP